MVDNTAKLYSVCMCVACILAYWYNSVVFACVHMCTNFYTCLCLPARQSVYLCVFICMCMCLYIYVCVYVCVCVCVCECVHMKHVCIKPAVILHGCYDVQYTLPRVIFHQFIHSFLLPVRTLSFQCA